MFSLADEVALEQLSRGATAMGCWVVGLFFWRFWKRSQDRFFFWFALSFWILAGNRAALVILQGRSEHIAVIYWIRLLAFLMILVAILLKNRETKSAK